MIFEPVRAPLARTWLLALLGLGAALTGLGPAPAIADDAAYVGIWGVELRYCGAPPADPNSPMAMTNDGYDHHLTHCSFTTVEPQGNQFKIAAECSLDDGTVKPSQITLAVAGNTLSFTDETGARDFLRCE